jgi:hypothetical protein
MFNAARLQATTQLNTTQTPAINICMKPSVNDVHYESFSKKGKSVRHFRTWYPKPNKKMEIEIKDTNTHALSQVPNAQYDHCKSLHAGIAIKVAGSSARIT